jgi:hypothetical protein
LIALTACSVAGSGPYRNAVFEHRHDPLPPRRDFLRRPARHALIAGGILFAPVVHRAIHKFHLESGSSGR